MNNLLHVLPRNTQKNKSRAITIKQYMHYQRLYGRGVTERARIDKREQICAVGGPPWSSSSRCQPYGVSASVVEQRSRQEKGSRRNEGSDDSIDGTGSIIATNTSSIGQLLLDVVVVVVVDAVGVLDVEVLVGTGVVVVVVIDVVVVLDAEVLVDTTATHSRIDKENLIQEGFVITTVVS